MNECIYLGYTNRLICHYGSQAINLMTNEVLLPYVVLPFTRHFNLCTLMICSSLSLVEFAYTVPKKLHENGRTRSSARDSGSKFGNSRQLQSIDWLRSFCRNFTYILKFVSAAQMCEEIPTCFSTERIFSFDIIQQCVCVVLKIHKDHEKCMTYAVTWFSKLYLFKTH